MRFYTTILAVIALIASMSTAAVAYSEQLDSSNGSRVVVTQAGPVLGAVNPTTVAFLGIPYAKPPVGELRWRAPQPFGRWIGVLNATQFGKHCPQLPPVVDPDASEACLFLNVYVPRDAEGEPHAS